MWGNNLCYTTKTKICSGRDLMVWGYIKSNGIRKLIKTNERENYFAMVLPLTKFLIDEDIALLQA